MDKSTITPEVEAMFARVKKSRVFNNLISSYDLDKKAVLDVGCSQGHHLACFGPGSQGVTIIDDHVTAARELGLDVVKKNVEDPNFAMETQFDVVWANNFFEHMDAPHPFLRKMAECIKPGGVIILGVPVIPWFTWLGNFKKFRGAYASSHVNFFYRKTLIETVKAAGYEVKEARLFYMKNPMLDWPFNFITPFISLVAVPREDFTYSKKRILSLQGYEEYSDKL